MMRWTFGLLLWGRYRGMAGRDARAPWGHVAPGLDPTPPGRMCGRCTFRGSGVKIPGETENAHAYP